MWDKQNLIIDKLIKDIIGGDFTPLLFSKYLISNGNNIGIVDEISDWIDGKEWISIKSDNEVRSADRKRWGRDD